MTFSISAPSRRWIAAILLALTLGGLAAECNGGGGGGRAVPVLARVR